MKKNLIHQLLNNMFQQTGNFEIINDDVKNEKISFEYDPKTENSSIFVNGYRQAETNGWGFDYGRGIKLHTGDVIMPEGSLKEALGTDVIIMTCEDNLVGFLPIIDNNDVYYEWRNIFEEYFLSIPPFKRVLFHNIYMMMKKLVAIIYHSL